MARRITDIVDEGEVLGVVGGVAASVPLPDPDAADVAFTPAGTVAATNVQAAIEEVAAEAGGSPVASDVSIADAGGYYTGTDVEAALQELGAGVGGSSSTWAAYTPTWTAATTNPAIGNGTLAGRYVRDGDTVHFWINLTFGTTTTVGSGVWRFGLPVAASAEYASQHGLAVSGYMENFALQGYIVPASRLAPGSVTTIELLTAAASGNGFGTLVSSGAPFTMADQDYLRFSGSYEAGNS